MLPKVLVTWSELIQLMMQLRFHFISSFFFFKPSFPVFSYLLFHLSIFSSHHQTYASNDIL